jgi:hypothetical protein
LAHWKEFDYRSCVERIRGTFRDADRGERCAYIVRGFRERGSAIPKLMREIGRARETTFRGGGGNLVRWHKASSRVAGSYRLAWTQDVLSTLFLFVAAFFRALGPTVELGRSFISPEFQKDYAPLLLLWQAIGRSVARGPTRLCSSGQ